jgi:hypothetical protein
VCAPAGTPSSPETQEFHSGFAQFPDDSARQRFVRSTLEDDLNLKDRAFLAETQPTITFENLTAAQRDRIRSSLQGLGHWFDDVQFHPMV